MNPSSPAALKRHPEPTPFVANLAEYILSSQEVWRLPDASEALKLDWNEGTLTHSVVVEAISRFLSQAGVVNWYPDVTCRRVVEPLTKLLNVPANNLLVFPGSDVALDSLVRTFVMPGDEAILLAPTYDNFRIYVESCGARIHHVSLTNTLGFDVGEFVKRVEGLTTRPKIMYLVNPNNPIGYFIPPEEIRLLLNRFPDTVMVVDEAYAEFAGSSSLPLIDEFPNLFVARSFSKAFALAGLRLGYLASQHANLGHINKVRNPKNISMLAQVGAQALLDRYDLVQEYVNEVVAARSWFLETMRSMGGTLFDSRANFVLMRVEEPKKVIQGLAGSQIYARDRSYMPGLAKMIRISIGTRSQMKQVVRAIQQLPTSLWRA